MATECFAITSKPEVEVGILDSTGRELKVKALVDTGFSGWLLIDHETFKELRALLLPFTTKYRSVSGVVEVESARAVIRIGRVKVTGFVQSFPGLDLNLLGREVLRHFSFCVDHMKEMCFSTE
jgi:clan AA aspartic protease